MRIHTTLPFIALLFAGCADEPTEARICDDLWFMDADGDGFGDPWSEPRVACAASCDHSASNALDCDDSDAVTTAQTAGRCPVDTFSDEDVYTAVQTPSLEYVVFYGATPHVDPVAAVEGCAAWGGELAAWTNAFAMVEVTRELAQTSIYAGYVGIEPNGDGGWRWTVESSMRLDDMFCADEAPVPTGPEDRLALVKRGSEFCVGRPADAPQIAGAMTYTANEGHAICQRLRPFPEDLN